MKHVLELTEFEIRAILGIVYPAWDDDNYEVMKEKHTADTRTIIFRSLLTKASRRKYDVIMHFNHDIDIWETYISTGSRGKIEIRNVAAYIQFLMTLE
ncbi:MAG: hypothetical protein K8R90_06930 [Candidatus Cloacimonetes bacterium]|nr:hypothetical protein [Candidatus Cloacimonadota bacterium]